MECTTSPCYLSSMVSLCRDCLDLSDAQSRCRVCRSPRLVSHPELATLSIAHIDCDAFYASVEKRDDPSLRDLPVIVGGGKRGVVSTCCYNARIKGIRSAMPMFKALKLCPEAVVVKPRMSAYVEVSRQIKSLMQELTPVVEPLSLDEAFLDLSGTRRLHGAPPAVMLARLISRIEEEIGVTASVGLATNKFLAKIASDLDKPRGFSVLGSEDAAEFLKRQKVGIIWGVGAATRARLEKDGIRTIADILPRSRKALADRYGGFGDRLWHLSRGMDFRSVSPRAPVKSISNETTFFDDTSNTDTLDGHLWRLSEKVADRAKATEKAGKVVQLKLKKADFKGVSRQITLDAPTQSADLIYKAARPLLENELTNGPYRLIGVGLSHITSAENAGQIGSLLDPDRATRQKAELATDAIRRRYGDAAIVKGRGLKT